MTVKQIVEGDALLREEGAEVTWAMQRSVHHVDPVTGALIRSFPLDEKVAGAGDGAAGGGQPISIVRREYAVTSEVGYIFLDRCI